MQAIVYHRYGDSDVLECREVDKPVVADEQVLVRVHAAALNAGDWYAMTGLYIARTELGWRKPKNPRLGVDFAGVVEAVGHSVTKFRPGDAVFGGRTGAFAEYVVLHEDGALVLKPPTVTFEQAAAVPVAALTALQGLRDMGQIQPGQQVLINGASGGVGTFAVQLAKWFGAEVTGVCSPRNVELVRSLGADHVVDYTQEDFTRSTRRYDLLLDIAGGRSWSECRRVLNPNARFVIIGGPKTNRWIGPLSHIIKVRLAALRATQKVIFFIAKLDKADLLILQSLLETGTLTPVIDRRYELSQFPQAMSYLGTGHAKGKIVITLEHSAGK